MSLSDLSVARLLGSLSARAVAWCRRGCARRVVRACAHTIYDTVIYLIDISTENGGRVTGTIRGAVKPGRIRRAPVRLRAPGIRKPTQAERGAHKAPSPLRAPLPVQSAGGGGGRARLRTGTRERRDTRAKGQAEPEELRRNRVFPSSVCIHPASCARSYWYRPYYDREILRYSTHAEIA